MITVFLAVIREVNDWNINLMKQSATLPSERTLLLNPQGRKSRQGNLQQKGSVTHVITHIYK